MAKSCSIIFDDRRYGISRILDSAERILSKNLDPRGNREQLKIAYVAGNPKLCFSGLWRSLQEELESIARIHGTEDRLPSLIEEFELSDHLQKDVSNLSGGESVRAAVGYLSLCQPRCWILDRTFEWLEPRHRFSMDRFFNVEAEAGKRIILLETKRAGEIRNSSDLQIRPDAWWTTRNDKIGTDLNLAKQNSIRARGVSVRYPDGTEVGPFDFDALNSERVGIVGPNGAGKTTLAMAIAGLIGHAGSIEIEAISMDSRSNRTDLCVYTFQNPDDQIFRPTVESEVFEIAKRLNVLDPIFSESIVECLALSDMMDADPIHLPLSLRRLVTIASALVSKSPVVFLDEPTSFLSSDQIRMVGKAIQIAARSGSTIVAITHDRSFAATHLDRLVQIG